MSINFFFNYIIGSAVCFYLIYFYLLKQSTKKLAVTVLLFALGVYLKIGLSSIFLPILFIQSCIDRKEMKVYKELNDFLLGCSILYTMLQFSSTGALPCGNDAFFTFGMAVIFLILGLKGNLGMGDVKVLIAYLLVVPTIPFFLGFFTGSVVFLIYMMNKNKKEDHRFFVKGKKCFFFPFLMISYIISIGISYICTIL